MASRYQSKTKERSVGPSGSRPSPGTGSQTVSDVPVKTVSWPSLSPKSGSNMNKVGFSKVRIHPAGDI
jgi:hypothetical protein